jgi:hypothetical protein
MEANDAETVPPRDTAMTPVETLIACLALGIWWAIITYATKEK